jgi:hypothetical protein
MWYHRIITAGALTAALAAGTVACKGTQNAAPGTDTGRATAPPSAPSFPMASPSVTEIPSPTVMPWVQPGEERVVVDTPSPSDTVRASSPTVSNTVPTVRPSTPRAPASARASAPAPTSAPVRTPAPVPQTTASPPPTPAGNTLRIGNWTHGYVTSHSQASLDTCQVVEWTPLWFAGHNWCGYQFWANLGVGTKIVLTGKNAGTYTVTQRVYLPYQGGERPALPAYDLALQTCKGSGTQLVLAVKTG